MLTYIAVYMAVGMAIYMWFEHAPNQVTGSVWQEVGWLVVVVFGWPIIMASIFYMIWRSNK